MGLFDMFGKSLDDQVKNAMNDIGATTPGVSGLEAEVRGWPALNSRLGLCSCPEAYCDRTPRRKGKSDTLWM